MPLYEILVEGFHTPLTAAEISNLFCAGQLNPDDPCRPAGKKKWHTVEELFPLLNRDLPWRPMYPGDESELTPNRSLVVICVVTGVLGFSVVWFAAHSWSEAATTGTRSVSTGASSSLTSATLTAHESSTAASPVRWNRSRPNPESENEKLEQQRLAREELQGEQAALADRLRAENRRQSIENQRSSGRDVIAQLDMPIAVEVGGSRVSVQIHDDDTNSFDVWLNGVHQRQMMKQKGISHSGTDETLLYSNGRARLYYVWEISGRLDSCLLRVREE